MNRELFDNILDKCRGYYSKFSKLNKELREELANARDEAINDNIATTKELVEIANMLKYQKAATNSQPKQNNVHFAGRRGPMMGNKAEKAKNQKGTIARLFKYFKTEIPLIIVLFISITVMVVAQVLTPNLQSAAIDNIKDGIFDKVDNILIIMLVLFSVLSIFSLIQGLLSAKLSQKIVKRMRADLFNKIINLPIKYFDTHSHGDIMSRMTNDVDNISNTLASSLGSLFSGVLLIIGTVIMMFITSWQLALISCSIVILTVIATKLLSKAMRRFYKKRQILLGRLNGTVEEMVVGHKTVKAFSMEDEIANEFDVTSDELTKTGIIAETLGGSMGPVMNCINNIGFVIISIFGGYFAFTGLISVGVISAFIIYAKQFSRPINEIAQLYGTLQTAIASAERVFIVLDEKLEDKTGAEVMEDKKGIIEFKNVDFSYVEGIQVLYDFSLEVYNGHKVALVGATGSGKTTVVNLLMRFYNIQNGSINIDGCNILDIDSNDLRKNIGIVLQDTILFKDTIRNNLKYANPNITDEEMIEAAKECHCHSFIMQMKDGYDSVLSEGGSNLSQGQRQLLAICRAFLAKPKILILDEATSSVDTRTEKHIQDAMFKLMEGRTSLIIAHRLSTIQDADFIVVMDKGRIVESGNHEELINKNGKYSDLYNRQFAGEGI